MITTDAVKLDPITLDRIKLLHPSIREKALSAYVEMCHALNGRAMVRFTYTLRTMAEQMALYNLGRTKKNPDGVSPKKPMGNIVTNASVGLSFHNYGLAFDIALVLDTDGNGTFDKGSWDIKGDYDGDKKSDWMECVAIAKKHGFKWGGDFVSFYDAPHFEMPSGYTVRVLLGMYNQKKFITGTNYLKL